MARLRPVAVHPTHVTLVGRNRFAELSVTGPGVFRLRAGRGSPTPPSPSWALVDIPFGSPATAIATKPARSPKTVSVESADGRLTWNCTTGAWSLRAGNLTLFECGADGIGFDGDAARVSLHLAERESLFGLGETTGTFNKRGLVREFWNTDVLGHAPAIHPSLRSLYVSVPFALSMRDGRAAGLFWDNPCRQTWDLGQAQPDRWEMTAAAGGIDLFLFTGPTPAEVLAAYTRLTGRIPMPPLWALGFQQCRYSYETAARVTAVAREFRRRNLPCDALYLDIHHMDGYRVFTFGRGFPKPKSLIRTLARTGFQTVAIVDPGVKDDPEFGVLQRGIQAGAFVRDGSSEADFMGEVWPGRSRFPDFLNAATRAWWGHEQRALIDLGVAGIWNDMNEPANFARPDKTLAPDARHRTDHGPAPHAAVHNVYGMQMSRACQEGALSVRPGQRPFVVTRATYAGGQRHAVVWTGDNSSSWDHLRDSVQMLLNLGLSGMAFCGGDVGGFLDNATPELFTRWFQFAAFTPFFRAHSNIGTRDHEPWAFGPDTEDIARRILSLRYALVPYLYCLVDAARCTGSPPMRPLLWHHPNDPVAVARGDQFLLGRDLLIAPVLEQGSVARAVYLPNDVWHDFWTGAVLEGGQHHLVDAPLDRIPLFVRAGAILPMVPPAPHTGALDLSEVTLNVWPGLNEGFDWYEDDGRTPAHEQGAWHRRRFSVSISKRQRILRFHPPEGSLTSRVRKWRVVLHDVPQRLRIRVSDPTHATPVPGTAESEEARLAVVEVEGSVDELEIRFGPID